MRQPFFIIIILHVLIAPFADDIPQALTTFLGRRRQWCEEVETIIDQYRDLHMEQDRLTMQLVQLEKVLPARVKSFRAPV